jgi:hypothetical protein
LARGEKQSRLGEEPSPILFDDGEADETCEVFQALPEIAKGGAAVHSILVGIYVPDDLLGVN